MNIRETLLEEHSKAQCKKIVDFIGDDKKRFAVLMKEFLGNEYRVTQRAAWPLSNIAIKYPALIQPYFPSLIKMLEKPGVHNAVLRNITRILQAIEIPKRFHGRIMTTSFQFISDINTPVAVKAFALTILDRLSGHYPEIRQELKLIIEERWPHESAAFKSRARHILKR